MSNDEFIALFSKYSLPLHVVVKGKCFVTFEFYRTIPAIEMMTLDAFDVPTGNIDVPTSEAVLCKVTLTHDEIQMSKLETLLKLLTWRSDLQRNAR